MADDEFLAREILGHGAYLCLRRADGATASPELRSAGAGRVEALAAKLDLRNEFDPAGPGAGGSFAMLRRVGATASDLPDDAVLGADWVMHVASKGGDTVAEFCGEVSRLAEPAAQVRVLRGQSRPRNYTGAAMQNWAYGRQVVQQPGAAMPNGFLVPMSKTAEWWAKGWMERHTYFLPRYDEAGRMLSEGHALATEEGIAHLMRRTYRAATEPAPDGEYDFLTYFECSDAGIPVFHRVCAALRDVARNPEWRFVREGPTWHGRRVATWEELFATR